MRTIEEIRQSNEETIAAFDRGIEKRQELLRQYQRLNQQVTACYQSIASDSEWSRCRKA